MGNTVLGRGKLYFDRYADGTENTTGARYLGNTPSLGLSVETQEAEHYSSEEGLRVKDLSVTLQIDYTATFVTDNIDLDNVALFFFGEKSTVTQAALTGEEDAITVLQGRHYPLGVTDVNPVGVRSVTVTSVTGTGGTPTYVVDTDYTVDAALGIVYIVPGGAIADATDVEIGYNVDGHTHDLVVSGSDLVYGELRFYSYNGVGEQKDFVFPKIALRPNGEYALKGEDWQQFGFNVEVLKKGDLNHVYADGRPYNIT